MYQNVKNVLVTGGIVSSLLLTGAATTFAQTSTASQVRNVKPMHNMRRADHLADMATKLGLNTDEIKKALDAGKKWPDILKENNITQEQIKTAFGGQGMGMGNAMGIRKGRGGPRMEMSPQLLEVQANILGISTDELKTTMKNRETLKTIITGKGLTMETFHQKVNAQILQMITDGKITGTQADLLQHMINHKVGNKTEVKVQG